MVPPDATKTVFFSKRSLAQKMLWLSMWDWPKLFSLAKSNFIGKIFFQSSNLFCETDDVRPSATKIDFFRKIPRSKKVLFVNVGRS